MADFAGAIRTSFDKRGLLRDYRLWPEMALKTLENVDVSALRPVSGRVFVAGMGASAAGPELLRDALAPEGLAIGVLRSHLVPSGLSQDDLFVAISLSGNTEETVYTLDQASKRKCQAVALSAGGLLEAVAKKKKIPFVPIKGGLTARSSLPVFLGGLSKVIDVAKPGHHLARRLESSLTQLKPLAATCDDVDDPRNEAVTTAKWLNEAAHIVVYHSPFNPSAAHRFKNVLSENAKALCTVTGVMDVMHDGITCWERERGSRLVCLPSPLDDEVVNHRFSLIREEVEALGSSVRTLRSAEGDFLSSLLSSFCLLDYVSMYLALLRGVDPGETRTQEELKRKVSQSSSLSQYLRSSYE
jgi:glucose/mannose-6-phosphate isomerase